MDSDDIAAPDRLARQVDYMESHQDVDVVGSSIEVINEAGEAVGTHRFPVSDPDIRSALLRGSCPICHPTVLVRTHALRAVGGYRYALVHAEDYDLWLRLADRSHFANLDLPLLRYRRHPDQVSIRYFAQQAINTLAARKAALIRRIGRNDPLDSVREITREVLNQMGVTETEQNAALVWAHVICIHSMVDAGELAAALIARGELLDSPAWKFAENWMVAEYYLLVARLYWLQARVVKRIASAVYAIVIRPIILGRPIKLMLCQFGLVERSH